MRDYDALLEPATLRAKQQHPEAEGGILELLAHLEAVEVIDRTIRWCSKNGKGDDAIEVVSDLIRLQRIAATRRNCLYFPGVKLPEQYTSGHPY